MERVRIRLKINIDEFDGRKIAENRQLTVELDYPKLDGRREIDLVTQMVANNLSDWTKSIQGTTWSNLTWAHRVLKIVKGDHP